MLLDLSAAFDTINQDILIERCQKLFGIHGQALEWLKSYLHLRSQVVQVNGSSSEPAPLSCGVPQGSILGPLLFIMYTTPLGSILRDEGTDYHLYADDTNLYLVFKLNMIGAATRHMENTITTVQSWMTINQLKLNTNKTELMVVCQKQHLPTLKATVLQVGSDTIVASTSVPDIGVLYKTANK